MHCILRDLWEMYLTPRGEVRNSFVSVLRRGILRLYKAKRVAKKLINLGLNTTFYLTQTKAIHF